jgi:SsrA-binding protein
MSILNKKASYEYFIFEKFIAGIQLVGTEVKSIKANKASITEAFCVVENSEVFIRNMYIAEYSSSKHTNHLPNRERKLLLNKNEIIKIGKKITEKGFSLIPLKVFTNDKGLIKIEIAIAKGKKIYDKRESIKEREYKPNFQEYNQY